MIALDEKKLLDAGLRVDAVREHRKNVECYLAQSGSRTFSIVETCRVDNGAILKCLPSHNVDLSSVVSFIPAAGASSRWLSPLDGLILAIHQEDRATLKKVIADLVSNGILDCPIPMTLRKLLAHWQLCGDLPEDVSLNSLLLDIESPKALYPAVYEGATFLEMKRREDESLAGLGGEVFVCPKGRAVQFTAAVDVVAREPNLKSVALEQGDALATVRWSRDLSVCLDENGGVAKVPAGHGALLQLLPRIRETFPGAHTAWIRNIDNVVGTSKEAVAATTSFLGTHQHILMTISKIRIFLADKDLEAAELAAKALMTTFALSGDGPSALGQLALKMFHKDIGTYPSVSDAVKMFSRPVVTMGQVPNTTKDVGGTAVFAKVGEVTHKLCIEVPHASASDRQKFLEDPSLATHFNPVFVAIEIPSDRQLDEWGDHPFWLIAKKSWRGRDVWYQESILYEMIGSSEYTNLTFVEIPRILFNPHKALSDAKNRKLADWL